MNEKMMQVARRAVACPGWRWMERMLTTDGFTVLGAHSRIPVAIFDGGNMVRTRREDWLPDLDDPATLGCLLALVRESWPTAPATTGHHGTYSPERGHHSMWTCSYCAGERWEQSHGGTEAEALVVALEAAGERAR